MLSRTLESYRDVTFVLLRVVAGLMFAFHGMQKLFGVLSDRGTVEMFSQLWFGGVIELVGGVAIAVGFFTAWAAFIASGTMAVAYIQFHWKLKFGERFFPAINGGETALLYSFVFLYIASHGPGRLSWDKR